MQTRPVPATSDPAPTPRPENPRPGAEPVLSRESAVLGGAAIAVGLLAAGGVYAFKAWIAVVQSGALSLTRLLPGAAWPWATALVPAVGGLLVGLVVVFVIGEERHHGVAGVMEATALAGGRLRWRRMPVKAVAAGTAIGTGASVGPEDPSVQIGANLGSFFGVTLRLSDDRVRALVASGAAAGIAAAFDAPIAGVFFALEIVLGELAAGSLGLILLAAMSSAALTHSLVGEHPAFDVPAYALKSAGELPLYVLLGVAAGVVAGLYVTALYAAQDLFAHVKAPRWAKPAVAGLVVGVVGLSLPQVLGVGYSGIEAALQGGLAPGLLLSLLVAKLAMTAVCIGSGVPGGVFAPSLFLGAMLGAAAGAAVARFAPIPGVEPQAYAIVGMGAVLAGAVHAPLTAILLLFEMTRDYRIMVPAMLSVATSLAVARAIRRESVYTLGLARKGIRLERGRDVEVLATIQVAEAMQTAVPTVLESAPAAEALEAVHRTRHLGIAVLDAEGRLAGIVAAQDLDRAGADGGLAGRTVGDVCTKELLVAHPDETLAAALRRMSVRDVGRLPVVPRDDPHRLVGMLRRSDVVRAYDVALGRRAALRNQAQRVRLSASTDARVDEVVVARGAACDGRRVRDVAWPRDFVLATVRRGERVLLPRGDTTLEAGDVLVVLTEGEAASAVRRLCGAPK